MSNPSWRMMVTAATLMALPPLMMTSACGSDDPPVDPTTTSSTGTGAGNSGGSDPGDGICLLNNCTDDAHCLGCADGRDTCLVDENRCVACDPNTGDGCPDGEACTSFGLCAPEGQTCPTDNEGNPQVMCTQNKDCAACSPLHQVCDTQTGKCQACTATNTQHCLSSDICIDTNDDDRPETCSPKCPQSCDENNDCLQCGTGENAARACYEHKCAECSDTFPCAAGEQCVNGVCTPQCGLPGPTPGDCEANEDCQFCGDQNGPAWTCKIPINDTRGNCVPQATGCGDLGSSVAVLPPPYDQFTQTCSDDNDCVQAMAGIQYNVGKAIRDLTNTNQINLGFTQIPIGDANVFYGMDRCASIEISNDISCGVCVPCKEDADCDSIPIQPLVNDIFDNDPLATVAATVLFDLLWGTESNPALHFFCQPVAAGYGACIPCGNPLQACGNTGGGGPGTGNCDHNVCTIGTALNGTCSQCAQDVCNADPFCCDATNGSWDQFCINKANELCGNICNGGMACAHDECTVGTALNSNCSGCAAAICAHDPYCCNAQNGSWDATCTGWVNDAMFATQCASACQGCSHDECTTGGALTTGCSQCATDVCTQDAYCCNTDWDSICVNLAGMTGSCNCP